MLPRYAVRNFLNGAAPSANENPDWLPFTCAVQAVRRWTQNPGTFPCEEPLAH